jgi:peptidoglycan/LPS O-acetylase OafA/YrhL
VGDRRALSGAGEPHKLSHIQALRAYAALAVVIYHVSVRSLVLLDRPFWTASLSWGATGVDTFFVLSGFIIMTVHRRDISRRSQLRPYLIKRALRIYPIYWLVTLAVLPAYIAGYGDTAKRSFDVVIRSLTLFPQHVGGSPIVNVGWTLSFEIFFYLVFAALIAIPMRYSAPLVVAWLGPCIFVFVCTVSGLWHPTFTLLWTFLFNPRNLEFALGAAIALYGPAITLRRPRLWLIAGVAVLVTVAAISAVTTVSIPQRSVAVTGLPSGLMVLAAAQLDRQGAAAPRFLEAVGDASYSLYLIHYEVLSVFFRAARHLHLVNDATWPVVLVLGAALAVVLALAVFRFIEAPFLRRTRRRFLKPAEARPPAVATAPGGS